jgi:hypothetical protein
LNDEQFAARPNHVDADQTAMIAGMMDGLEQNWEQQP